MCIAIRAAMIDESRWVAQWSAPEQVPIFSMSNAIYARKEIIAKGN